MDDVKLEVGQVYKNKFESTIEIIDAYPLKDIVNYVWKDRYGSFCNDQGTFNSLENLIEEYEYKLVIKNTQPQVQSTKQSVTTSSTFPACNIKVGEIYTNNIGETIEITHVNEGGDVVGYTSISKYNQRLGMFYKLSSFETLLKRNGFALQTVPQTPLSVNLNNATICTPPGGTDLLHVNDNITREQPSIGCECGAHKLGHNGKGPAHSTWCPMFERF